MAQKMTQEKDLFSNKKREKMTREKIREIGRHIFKKKKKLPR